MNFACRVARFLLTMFNTKLVLGIPLEEHVNSCLQCQAESARDRRLQRSLVSLPADAEVAPINLAKTVEARIDGYLPAPPSPGLRRVGRVAAGVGAAVAAAGAVVVVRWLRTRATA